MTTSRQWGVETDSLSKNENDFQCMQSKITGPSTSKILTKVDELAYQDQI